MSVLEIWRTYTPFLMQGTLVTIQITILGLVISLILGLFGALGRLSSSKTWYRISSIYVETIRGTPELLQIFLLFFGLAQYGIRLSAISAAVLWLGVFGGAYVTEIFRAGIQSIDKGQFEAAEALGLARRSVLRKIILPQAVLLVLPPLTNFGILQIKASSLAYTIGVQEIMGKANIGALGTFRTMEIYLLAGAFYFALCYPLSKLVERVEKLVTKYR